MIMKSRMSQLIATFALAGLLGITQSFAQTGEFNLCDVIGRAAANMYSQFQSGMPYFAAKQQLDKDLEHLAIAVGREKADVLTRVYHTLLDLAYSSPPTTAQDFSLKQHRMCLGHRFGSD
jgi:hypothetical protein